MQILKNRKGFTLVELLLVIGIIAILVGVTITIINPARLLMRSRQSVARGKVAKACLAYRACMSANGENAASCNTAVLAGVDNFAGTVAESGTYSFVGGLPQWVPTATTEICTMTCNGTTGFVTVPATCAITQ